MAEPDSGWKTHTCPWLNFVYPVSSRPITRGSGNCSTEYLLWGGK